MEDVNAVTHLGEKNETYQMFDFCQTVSWVRNPVRAIILYNAYITTLKFP